MKYTFIILLIVMISGCNQKKEHIKVSSINDENITDSIPNKYFETISYKEKFEFTVNENYTGSNSVSCYGIGYHLLIGTTENSELPAKLSVLYHSIKPYDLKKGDKIIIIPDENQDFETNDFGVIYIVSDTIINGKTETHVLGSEYKSIWAERIEL